MKDSSSFGWLAKTKLLLMKTMLSPQNAGHGRVA